MSGEWVKEDQFIKDKYDNTTKTNKKFQEMFPSYDKFCETIQPALKKEEVKEPEKKEEGNGDGDKKD